MRRRADNARPAPRRKAQEPTRGPMRAKSPRTLSPTMSRPTSDAIISNPSAFCCTHPQQTRQGQQAIKTNTSLTAVQTPISVSQGQVRRRKIGPQHIVWKAILSFVEHGAFFVAVLSPISSSRFDDRYGDDDQCVGSQNNEHEQARSSTSGSQKAANGSGDAVHWR